MEHLHKSTGIIIYDPSRPGMKSGFKQNKNHRTDWWCVLDIDREITRYLRWHLAKNVPGLVLHNPAWDAHVSILRGEEPDNNKKHLWKKYHNKKIDFWYSTNVYNSNHFWTVYVYCPFIKEIRKEMNKPFDWDLHLTIGRTW